MLSLLLSPLDAFQTLAESLYKVPLTVPLLFVLAAVPIAWLEQLIGLVRQYPLIAFVITSLSLVLGCLCWVLFGTLLSALISTLWWLVWYAPLWLSVTRVVWITARRSIVRRLGWQPMIQSFYQSLQTRFYNTLHRLVMYRWFTTDGNAV